jgi:nitrite reductase/ring-hydroxylating ferredoxin subunit
VITRKIIALLFFLFTISCTKNEMNKNPYLHEVSFEKVINLNLPQYDNLNYNGGAIYLNSGGIKGLILFNFSNQIFAWEASCPNQYPSSCSTMRIDGVQSVCDCDNYKYSLATGQLLSSTENDAYPMKLYFSEKNGNSVRISN